MSNNINNHAERAHALLSASSSSRWLNCPASAMREDNTEPVEYESSFALEGTIAHEMAELEILKYLKRISITEYENNLIALTHSDFYYVGMEKDIEPYTDYVKESYLEALKQDKETKIIIEKKVNFSDVVPEGFGTCDCIIITKELIKVIDLKFGKGVRVYAKDNPQLKLYAYGACQEFSEDENMQIEVTIVQPRLDSIDTFELSKKDLYNWAKNEVKPIAEKAYKGTNDFKTGKWCTFCKYLGKCRAVYEDNIKLANTEFNDNDLSDEEYENLYDKLPVVKKWIDSIESHMVLEAEKGKKWNNFKLVRGRSIRKWRDEQGITDELALIYDKDIFMESKLKSVSKLEKELGKEDFNKLLSNHVVYANSKNSLVPRSDKREEIDLSTAKDDFL